MEKRPLGATGMQVSVLGLGAGHVGGAELSEDHVGWLLNAALDLGVNLVDTARGYGLSEERIGRHLAWRRRDFVLVSKCGYGVEGVADWTPECIRVGVDQALRRMRTDHIDVMMLHSCPRATLEQPGLLDALDDAVRAGKVRHAGYSGENEDLAYAILTGCFTVFETSVNVFDQRGLWELVPRMGAAGVIAKRPAGNAPWRFVERPHGHYGEVYWERMVQLGLRPGPLSWTEYALRFAAHAPGVHCAIVGTSSVEHLRENVRAVEAGPLSSEVFAEARAAFERVGRDWRGQV
ncbi:MAG: aldo/keto reductase [Myxococcota bacterium]